MAKPITSPNGETEVKDTDIVFNCPYCSKSLAIDYRGAGLTIKCSDCEKDVQVPIPEGMELNDIDSSDEEQEIRIMHLRRSLASAETRISSLESSLAAASAHKKQLEQTKVDVADRQTEILDGLTEVGNTLKKATESLDRVIQSDLL